VVSARGDERQRRQKQQGLEQCSPIGHDASLPRLEIAAITPPPLAGCRRTKA
jgi:hypothetical protein